MTDNAVSVFAIVIAQEGQAHALRTTLTELAAATRLEPGNVTYTVHEDLAKPGQFHIFEIYRDEAAVDHHMASPHFAVLLSRADVLIEGAPAIVRAKMVAGS
jgi:quinol monooxygenase YgiN